MYVYQLHVFNTLYYFYNILIDVEHSFPSCRVICRNIFSIWSCYPFVDRKVKDKTREKNMKFELQFPASFFDYFLKCFPPFSRHSRSFVAPCAPVIDCACVRRFTYVNASLEESLGNRERGVAVSRARKRVSRSHNSFLSCLPALLFLSPLLDCDWLQVASLTMFINLRGTMLRGVKERDIGAHESAKRYVRFD